MTRNALATLPPSSSNSSTPLHTPRRDGKPGWMSAAHELRREVLESLFSSGYAALHFVGCEVSGNRVILDGVVPSYHLKQLAQEFAQRVEGVGRIENRLEVKRRSRA